MRVSSVVCDVCYTTKSKVVPAVYAISAMRECDPSEATREGAKRAFCSDCGEKLGLPKFEKRPKGEPKPTRGRKASTKD